MESKHTQRVSRFASANQGTGWRSEPSYPIDGSVPYWEHISTASPYPIPAQPMYATQYYTPSPMMQSGMPSGAMPSGAMPPGMMPVGMVPPGMVGMHMSSLEYVPPADDPLAYLPTNEAMMGYDASSVYGGQVAALPTAGYVAYEHNGTTTFHQPGSSAMPMMVQPQQSQPQQYQQMPGYHHTFDAMFVGSANPAPMRAQVQDFVPPSF